MNCICPTGGQDPWCDEHPMKWALLDEDDRPSEDPWTPICDGKGCGGYPHE